MIHSHKGRPSTQKGCLVHRTGNVLVADFHQVDRRLHIAGGVGEFGCKDKSPTIDGDQLGAVRGDNGCGCNIGQSSSASLRALAAPDPVPSRHSPLSVAGLFNGFTSQAFTRLNAVFCKVPLLFAVRADVGWFVLMRGQEGRGVVAALCRMGATDRVLLIKTMEDGVGAECQRVHCREDRRLHSVEMVPKGINKEDDLELVEVNGAHLGDFVMQHQDVLSSLTEWGFGVIVIVQHLFDHEKLGVHAKFFMTKAEFLEDEVGGG